MGAPQKISKDMVIEAGLNVLRKKGFDAVSARSIANETCILSANHISHREPVEGQADFRYDVEE